MVDVGKIENQQTPKQINPWFEKLTQQGLDLTIAEKHRQIVAPIGGLVRDELTGLYIENDHLRTFLATKLGNCVSNGKKFACIYSDADNLKKANTQHGRDLGDMVIIDATAHLSQSLEKVGLSDQVKTYFHREKQGADEIVIWLFDLSEEQLTRLKKQFTEVDSSRTIKNPDFTFSTTTVVLDGEDPRLANYYKETANWLTANNSEIPYDFYQKIKNTADFDVKLIKTSKDLVRLPMDQLLTTVNIHKFIEILVSNLGDSRISSQLLEVICKLSSIEGVLSVMGSQEYEQQYKLLLEKLGITKEDLTKAKTPKMLLDIFQDLFGKEK